MTQPVVMDSAELGLFGPDSVTWQVHGDVAMWFGGVRSLFLQALHPRAVAGVVQNSDFQADPLGRLIRTATYVGATTYGTLAEAEGAAARVRRVHRSLKARDPETGARYGVDEPDLLLWVHCAEVSSFLSVVRRAGFPLTEAHADRYFHEQRTSAALVGLDPAGVPGSVAQMRDYFRRVYPTLRHTPDAEVIHDFLHRPPVKGGLAAALPLYQAGIGHLSYSLLPGWARRMYGRRGYPETAATLALRAFRAAAAAMPGGFRIAREPEPAPVAAVRRLGAWATPSARRLPDL